MIGLLMLVSNFMMNSMLKILKGIYGMHGKSKQGCIEERKKKNAKLSVYPRVGMIKSLPVRNCLALHMSRMNSVLTIN